MSDIIYKVNCDGEVACDRGLTIIDDRIKVNYKLLWKLLIDRDISKGELHKKIKIAASTFTKMTNNENSFLDVLCVLC